MHWITRSSGAVFSIADNQRIAGLISVIATALARGDSLGGVGDLIGVLDGLDRNPALREQLLELFAHQAVDVLDGMLPDDAYDDLLGVLRSPEMRRRLPDLRLLGCRWDQIGSAVCSGLEPRMRWHGLDRLARSGDVASAPVAALSFDIGAHAARALVLEPIDAADVPDTFGGEVRAVLQRGLRLTLTGEAKAGAGVEIPIRFGAIGIGGESAGSARLDFYVDRGNDALIANSFAAAVGSLGNPFDLHAIERAFAARRLRAVRIEAGGSVGLNGALTVGLREKLFGAAGGGLDATLGAELRFHTARRGDYLANLYPAFPADAQRREVRLDIHRLRSREDSTSLALGLTLDLTPVLNDLGEALVDKADEAKVLLRRFNDFIPPSAAIRKGLDDRLEAQLSTEHRRLLADLLGSSADASASERLGQRLAEGLDRQAAVWGEQVGRLAEQVAADVVGRLLLPVAEQQAMRQIAAMAVEMSLEQARGALRERVEQDLNDAEDSALLARAFSLAGERVELGVDRLDEVAGRIGGQLDRLQGTVANLAKALRESSETKLRARWRVQETRSRSTSVQQSLLFRPGIAGAAELFQQAMTGSLEALFDRLRGAGDNDGDDGEPVSLIAGSLQEYAGVRRESGMELALLDFDLSNSHVMEAGVTIETDAAGNISICSRSRSRGRRSRLGGYTEHEVVNSFELAAARQTRRMSLSLALSQVEHDLAPDEAETFFDGFAKPDFRLLTRAQIDGAITAMPNAEQCRRGELRAWLELDAEGLTRLLRLPLDASRHPRPGLTKRQEREVYEAAVDALVAGLQFSGARAKWRNLTDHIDDKLDRKDVAVVLKQTFDGQHLARLRPSSHTDPREGPRFRTVEEIIGRARSLVRLVGQMRAVYLSDGTWPLDEYLARQEDIGNTISDWYKGEGLAAGASGLMSRKVGPFSLALFKAISDLCASDAADKPPLMASIVVERGGVEAEIPLLDEQPIATLVPTPPPPLPMRLLAATADAAGSAP